MVPAFSTVLQGRWHFGGNNNDLTWPIDNRTVAQGGACVPEIIVKLSTNCGPNEVLNASDHGCICQPKTLADRLSCCKAVILLCHWIFLLPTIFLITTTGPPKTAGTGVGKCTSKYDGSEAECDLECDSPWVQFDPSPLSFFFDNFL